MQSLSIRKCRKNIQLFNTYFFIMFIHLLFFNSHILTRAPISPLLPYTPKTCIRTNKSKIQRNPKVFDWGIRNPIQNTNKPRIQLKPKVSEWAQKKAQHASESVLHPAAGRGDKCVVSNVEFPDIISCLPHWYVWRLETVTEVVQRSH